MISRHKYSIGFILLIFGCSQPSKEITVTAINDADPKVLTIVIDNRKDKSVFIPENSWLKESNDTLFFEAVYKPNNDTTGILFNQFNPPLMQQISQGIVLKKLLYKDINIKLGSTVGVRFFLKRYPFDEDRDYEEYHSLKAFYEFETSNSFYVYAPVVSSDEISNW
jgi:hypothetical protein